MTPPEPPTAPESDPPAVAPAPQSGAGFGWFLIAVGVLTLLFVGDIRKPRVGTTVGPGPRVFPASLASALIAGGIILVGSALRRRVKPLPAPGISRSSSAVLTAILGLFLYVFVIGWVGFFPATAVFATGLMLAFGLPPARALAVSAGLLISVYVLFVWLLRVVLPEGSFP